MDEFQVVQRRKGKKRNQIISPLNNHQIPINEEFDRYECEKQISRCKEELIDSKFWKDFSTLLFHSTMCEEKRCTNAHREVPMGVLPFEELVVYGIGSLANSSIARYQFAFVLLLVKLSQLNCVIYDPVLLDEEKSMIESYGIGLIDTNEECKRRICFQTLFIMLHCGKAMYNNLLWANWGLTLEYVSILGNCFSSYEDRIVHRELKETSRYLSQIIPHTIEHKVSNSFHYDDIFNDTAMHTFPKTCLHDVPCEIWLHNEEPLTVENDTEIVRKKTIVSVTAE